MIQLNVEPLTPPATWEEFLARAPRCSVALDGYVIGGPKFDAHKVVANYNHHEGVDRLATRATCGQVLMAIRRGFFRAFRDDRGPCLTAYVNDCDEDVCVSWYLLSHGALSEQTMNPLLNRLVMMEDALDATAGAYPFPADLPVLRELAWVFEPYRQFRLSGGLDRRDARAFRAVVEDVVGRVERHVVGRGSEVPLDVRYDRIGGGAGWTMVREVGNEARTGLHADGVLAFVSVRERRDGRHTYVVGRTSPFVAFPVRRVLDACNSVESALAGDLGGDVWGGSDEIGGSPRAAGSRLTPDLVERIVRECCDAA